MVKQVLKKIKNKKWLSLCLVLGLTFLIATMSCHPMFKAGSLDKLIYRLFTDHIEESNTFPTVVGMEEYVLRDEVSSLEEIMPKIEQYQKTWHQKIQLPVLAQQLYFYMPNQLVKSLYNVKEFSCQVTYIPAFSEHAQIVSGEGYDTYQGDGIPCVVSEYVAERNNVLVGDNLEFSEWKDENKETLKLKVVGIFKASSDTDLFWQVEPKEMKGSVMVSEENYNMIWGKYVDDGAFFCCYEMFDYRAVTNENIDALTKGIVYLVKKDKAFTETFSPFLTEYFKGKKTVDITLWVLELPILGMIFAYIYMVACQIVETEKNEIAMIKSRGGSRFQVILMYVLQCVCLAVVSLFIGIPLGTLLCKMGAATTDFLSFSFAGLEIYRPVKEMLVYGLLAVICGIIFLLLPILGASKVSIVQRISSVKINKKPFWEKFFLDFALLAVSIYLIYNFNKNLPSIRENAISGGSVDPILFVNAVLFILACGLFILRLIQYLVKLVYRIGKKKWSPAMYASFLQITRTFNKQSGISVFLILTIALGLFYANVARTINSNSMERIVYDTGAEVVVSETWEKKHLVEMNTIIDYEYIEPDYIKYDELLKNGMCDRMTRVIRADKVEVAYNKTKLKNCVMQGIVTNEYGETATLRGELQGEKHWYHYLNMLAEEPNGVIISSNLAKELDVKVGQTVDLIRYFDVTTLEDKERGKMRGKICAIVDHWPGYQKYTYDSGEKEENYLVVANYATTLQYFKMSPYEVWMSPAKGVSSGELIEVLENMPLNRAKISSVDAQVKAYKESTIIQITNGMFTLSFIISLVLCVVGFMIYWIASVRQRELLFGIYRAMGMTVRDINSMLINEHLFSTLLSVLAGGGVGMIATILFARLFAVVYLPQEHNVSIFLHYDAGDILKLVLVIGAMMVACIIVLRKLIQSMNITQALKLGED